MKHIVAVIMGGYTSERDISLQSGAVVMEHLDTNSFEPYAVHIHSDGWKVKWDDNWVAINLSNFTATKEKKILCFDIVFNAIHGDPGENGKMQTYFDTLNLPYTGCSAKVSALTYNKVKTLNFLRPHGIAMAHHYELKKGKAIDYQYVSTQIGYPCFVKANQAGSSFGVVKVYREEELDAAITQALGEDESVLIESFLDGTEVSIGVITYNNQIRVLPPTEIICTTDFFDFSAKYEGKSQEITPARLTERQLKNVQQTAKQIYTLLGMKGVSRSDFIFIKDVPYFLEINTVPGLTQASLLPQQAQYAHISLQELFSNALFEAIKN